MALHLDIFVPKLITGALSLIVLRLEGGTSSGLRIALSCGVIVAILLQWPLARSLAGRRRRKARVYWPAKLLLEALSRVIEP